MKLTTSRHGSSGYALLLVLVITGISAFILAAAMNRTSTVSKLNERNNQYVLTLNAAEAATEKIFARMAYDFNNGGLGQVSNNLSSYRTDVPKTNEHSYWGNFVFSDGQGNDNRVGVYQISNNYSGNLPSQYDGLFAVKSPIYRVLANTRLKNGRYTITNAVQEDVLLALVPITTYAIFYNGLLEFSQCATMIVNGRVHSNTNIYVGTAASLTFSNTVTASGNITKPQLTGSGSTTWGTSGNSPLNGNTYFYGDPTYATNVPPVSISIPMTNTHAIIDMPTTNDASTLTGQQRLYNQAQVVLQITDSNVVARIQASPSSVDVPGTDSSPTNIVGYFTNMSVLSTNFPFLTTNAFYDQRESKTIINAQIDVAKYKTWLSTNLAVRGKFPTGSGTYPTILYVANLRANTSSQLSAVRLVNGISPPENGGLGFSVATQNPLYVLGNYNQTNASLLNQNNTTSGTVPCALISDALTVLSSAWSDSLSAGSYTGRNPANTTINAAIITGNVPSTGLATTAFSGGVHNLPRLLEDWSGETLTLNTSIISLFASTKATRQFQMPGAYYSAPTRKWAFDLNFYDPAKQPPGVPTALVPIRFNWGVPPPNTTNYNVTQ